MKELYDEFSEPFYVPDPKRTGKDAELEKLKKDAQEAICPIRSYHSSYIFATEVRLRSIFVIPSDEMVGDFEYDKPNSRLVLTTLKDYDKKRGDI